MSLVIPIFVGGREGGRWFIEFPGGGGVVKKRESPDFRPPEVGISAYEYFILHIYSLSLKCRRVQFDCVDQCVV